MIVEASGNEYVQQLLDRAANLIQSSVNEQDTDQQTAKLWLQEYQQEKSRFGQPNGSPASPVDADGRMRQDGDSTAQGAAEDRYESMSLADLQNEASNRGLPKSGTKAELAERLREDDRDPVQS